jgi:hypothetical protein
MNTVPFSSSQVYASVSVDQNPVRDRRDRRRPVRVSDQNPRLADRCASAATAADPRDVDVLLASNFYARRKDSVCNASRAPSIWVAAMPRCGQPGTRPPPTRTRPTGAPPPRPPPTRARGVNLISESGKRPASALHASQGSRAARARTHARRTHARGRSPTGPRDAPA